MIKFAIIFSLTLLLIGEWVEGAQFSPPEPNGDIQPLIDTLRLELQPERISNAAARADQLLHDHADDLVASGADGFISVSTLLKKICAEDSAGLAVQYGRQFDSAADAMLKTVRQSPRATPEALYAVSQRYPMTPTAAVACAAAGDRAGALGDWPTAQEYYRLAVLGGWTLDEAQTRRLAAMQAIAPAQAAAKNPPPRISPGYCGEIVSDYSWYLSPSASAAPRYIPVQAQNFVFITTARRALAFKDNGDLLWAYSFIEPTPQAADPKPVEVRPAGRKNLAPGKPVLPTWTTDTASLNEPRILSAGNSPQVVIVRGPTANNGIGLIALRASDGQSIWTTADQDSLAGLLFTPDPALSGRYVYAIAADPSRPQPLVDLLAIDIGTGREIWRAVLGSTAAPPPVRPKAASPLAFAESIDTDPAGITIDGDQLIVTPNVGYAFCVGRFDGKIRWIHKYAPVMLPELHRKAVAGARYDNHPAISGRIAIAAPQDGNSAFALDAVTGAQLWDAPQYADDTLVGTAGPLAIFASAQITAIDAKTSQPKWTFSPKPASITGPPVKYGELLYLPTTTGEIALAIDTGAIVPTAAKLTAMRVVIGSEAVRSALTLDGAISTFGLPESLVRKPPAHR